MAADKIADAITIITIYRRDVGVHGGIGIRAPDPDHEDALMRSPCLFHLGVLVGRGMSGFPGRIDAVAVDSGLCWFWPVHGSEADDPVNWNDMECTFPHIDIGGIPGANVRFGRDAGSQDRPPPSCELGKRCTSERFAPACADIRPHAPASGAGGDRRKRTRDANPAMAP